MKVLITGATGYIGNAVAEAVQRAGHEVHGLAHDSAAHVAIAGRGWTPVSGDIRNAARLEQLASAADAVVHAANTGGADAAAADTAATRALLRGLTEHGGTLVYTSGAWVIGSGRSDEASVPRPASLVAWRAALEQEVLRAGRVRGVVIRPGIVYGRGTGIPGMLLRGELPLIGSGTQRWPLVHVEDVAQLYALALSAPAGSVLHGVVTTMSMRDLARLASAASGAPVDTVTLEVAQARFGALADALALDIDTGSDATRALVGWNPAAPGVVEEFLERSYAHAARVAA